MVGWVALEWVFHVVQRCGVARWVVDIFLDEYRETELLGEEIRMFVVGRGRQIFNTALSNARSGFQNYKFHRNSCSCLDIL